MALQNIILLIQISGLCGFRTNSSYHSGLRDTLKKE